MSTRDGPAADPARAESYLPGGALGANANVEGRRFAVASASGPYITDTDGNRYLDYVTGAGALILGHQHPAVVEAVVRQAGRTMHQYGALTDVAIELASQLVDAIPCAERIVFATTGSEATAYSMRLARAVTGRDLIVKFEGGFHGNHDYAGIAVAAPTTADYPTGKPFTAGTPEPVRDTMLVVPYNDLEALERLVTPVMDRVAGIIAEPVQRIIPPLPGFLEGLRRFCDRHGLLLIFDEVVTGFRLSYQGAQGHFGVTPDLAAFGKIIGGGGTLSCVAGRADLIDRTSPRLKGTPRFVYTSGTFHGNPLAAAAGLATLEILRRPGCYEELADRTRRLSRLLTEVLEAHDRIAMVAVAGSLWQILHIGRPPERYADLLSSDQEVNRRLDRALLANGINVIPGLRRFVSLVHTDEHFEKTARALDRACHELAGTHDRAGGPG
jgi:glutamate-1-semialdehyde 2,1-aminomutase